MANQQTRVALVIGSGGVKCAAALGLYKALKREGIEIGMMVGAGVGVIYAALLALGLAPEQMADMGAQLWSHALTAKHKRRALWQILLPNVFGFDENFGTVDDTLLWERLRAAYGDAKIENTIIPLYIAATDFHNGEQVVLTQGNIVDAVRASLAIPYIFQAHRVDGRLLVDGSLSDPLPIGVAIKENANVILTLGFESPYQGKINALMRYSFQVSSVMSNNLLKANYAFHALAHHGEILPIRPQFQQHVGLFDTDKIPAIIAAGERAMEEQMPYLNKVLALAQ